MKKSTCKAQLRARMRHARSRKEKGKALGAYQKCLKSTRTRSRRGKHYKYWKGGWGED